MFVAETTVEQYLDLIAQFNSIPNKNHFNGVTRNCADFARRVINTYFPHAAGPDYINDFGMTSPKAVARSFTRYSLRHPETHFRVVHYAQIPGTIKRSSECRAGTEQLYRSKKLLIPMLIFANHELPFVAASYLFTGRFNPQRELEEHPSVEATEVEYQIQLANSGSKPAGTEQLELSESQERAEVVGTSEDWKKYRSAFDALVRAAVRQEIIRDRRDLKSFFQQLDEAGTPVADRNGALWIELSDREGKPRVGLSASNIFDPKSDWQFAYELVLARTERVLNSPKHSRETMVEFKKDWDLLQHGDSYGASSVLRAAAPAPGVGGMSFPGK
jgi:hypothetical protein